MKGDSKDKYEFTCNNCSAKETLNSYAARVQHYCERCSQLTDWEAVVDPRERREGKL